MSTLEMGPSCVQMFAQPTYAEGKSLHCAKKLSINVLRFLQKQPRSDQI